MLKPRSIERFLDRRPKRWRQYSVGVLTDAMINSNLPPDEYKKNRKSSGANSRWHGRSDRMATLLLFERLIKAPVRFPVIGELEIYNQLTQEQVMQY